MGRLEFNRSTAVLAYVGGKDVSPALTEHVAHSGGDEALSSSQGLFEEAGQACDDANIGPSRKLIYLRGSPSTEILGAAKVEGANLIAIGSRRQGRVGSAFLGSVGRTLAIQGDRSFLVGRSGVTTRGNARAIFATDHSEYADRCLQALLRLNPVGLTDLQIVFANESDTGALALASGLPDAENLEPEALLSATRSRGERLVQQCVEGGRKAEYQIVEGPALDALRAAMYAKKADLLILGARGHGFFERLRIGSLSLHMVVAEPFSVLVLRLPEEDEP
ncbi:MAG: universal stress protein [Fimbriimonas sp.]